MNEADTRAELIEPQLEASGWGVTDDSRILREFQITKGKILNGGVREKPLIADYILVYKNRKIGCIEAKSDETENSEGVGQAKNYAAKMEIDYTFSANAGGCRLRERSVNRNAKADRCPVFKRTD